MKKSEMKKIEKWELKHKIIAFVLIFILTILITRLIILIHDPNPFLFGYELHHFYYGILLLIFITLFMLFGKERYAVYFTLSAISIGLIADEFFFVLGRKLDSQYSQTWTSAAVFAFVIFLIMLGIRIFQRKK